eukprot:TRINITY_DN10741_c0_g1_i1.p1 TRINITY_DN10741_c0_g1~~TRINITY_DN10741_c0_g1_i1.p1  ORF type:complete len:860 (-),score=264.37 TRINITY_DN10741_c0_g1_i1:150-2729(-)
MSVAAISKNITPELNDALRRRLQRAEGSEVSLSEPPAVIVPHTGSDRSSKGSAIAGSLGPLIQRYQPSHISAPAPRVSLPSCLSDKSKPHAPAPRPARFSGAGIDMRRHQDSLSDLAARNATLTKEVERMKNRLLQGNYTSEQKNQMLAETDRMLAEVELIQTRNQRATRAHSGVEEKTSRQSQRQPHQGGGFVDVGQTQSNRKAWEDRVHQLPEPVTALNTSDELELLRRRVSQLEQANKELQGDLEEERRALAALQEAAAKRSTEEESLNEDIARLRCNSEAAEKAEHAAQEEAARLRGALQAAEQETLRLRTLLAESKTVQVRHKAELEASKATCDVALTEKARLCSELEGTRRKTVIADEKLAALQDEFIALKSQKALEVEKKVEKVEVNSSSEGRLRHVLTSRNSTTEDLKQAIGAVDALLGEARRELAAKELRARRAAFEELHGAIEAADETRLVAAIERAQKTGVEEEDLAKARTKLEELQSMTQDEKMLKLQTKKNAERRTRAFLLVKQNKVAELRALIAELDAEEVAWPDWKDHAQRTLWKCAQELRAASVQEMLAPLLGYAPPQPPAQGPGRPSDSGIGAAFRPVPSDGLDSVDLAGMSARNSLASNAAPKTGGDAGADVEQADVAFFRVASMGLDDSAAEPMGSQLSDEANWTQPAQQRLSHGGGKRQGDALRQPVVKVLWHEPEDPEEAPTYSHRAGDAVLAEEKTPRAFTDEEKRLHEELKTKALRAVVKDDVTALEEVLSQIEVDIWKEWQNKAGKDLMTLSEERGSTNAYSFLAKELGILQEMERETFEEGEDVWVFKTGDVQALRAKVMEDTTEEPDEILVEFWDGDDPPMRIPRCQVRKIHS